MFVLSYFMVCGFVVELVCFGCLCWF